LLQRAKEARIDIMMLTVDSITGGNRERDHWIKEGDNQVGVALRLATDKA
jgi:hypothetical protein